MYETQKQSALPLIELANMDCRFMPPRACLCTTAISVGSNPNPLFLCIIRTADSWFYHSTRNGHRNRHKLVSKLCRCDLLAWPLQTPPRIRSFHLVRGLVHHRRNSNPAVSIPLPSLSHTTDTYIEVSFPRPKAYPSKSSATSSGSLSPDMPGSVSNRLQRSSIGACRGIPSGLCCWRRRRGWWRLSI